MLDLNSKRKGPRLLPLQVDFLEVGQDTIGILNTGHALGFALDRCNQRFNLLAGL